MKQPDFAEILARAVQRKGGLAAVEANLPAYKSDVELAKLPDSFYLSTMSKRIFQAGLKHSMVNDRWPAFEEAFEGFEPSTLAMMSDDDLDSHLANPKLIRHLGKLKSIRHNAVMITDATREFGSFGRFLGSWPVTDIVSLWAWLKKRGNQLGGMSGARFLRLAGKDTFLITDDIVALLRSLDIVQKPPTAKRDLIEVQEIFNDWHSQSGRPMCEISRIASYTVNSAA